MVTEWVIAIACLFTFITIDAEDFRCKSSLDSSHVLDALNTARYRSLLKDEPSSRISELGKISDSEERLQRIFMSPAYFKASRIIQLWMQDAGLISWQDGVGNIHGRIDGPNPTEPAILLGSHMDTVLDAGKFDGLLGVICSISAVKALLELFGAQNLARPIEVIAFSDEEGIRFQSTFLGSNAIAGTFHHEILNSTDRKGYTLSEILSIFGFSGSTESGIEALKYKPEDVFGYIEVHMEQGPILEAQNLPLGVVSAIAGQNRLSVTINGTQGHAGTVPMSMRRDPMVAAALSVISIESLCANFESHKHITERDPMGEDLSGLVCTVGDMKLWPGASNVIPGQVVFSLDVRSRSDSVREEAVQQVMDKIREICEGRGLSLDIVRKHSAMATECSKDLSNDLEEAARQVVSSLQTGHGDLKSEEISIPRIISGAGHDAMAMASLAKIGMLFVRCKGGVSHSPKEFVADEDIHSATAALLLTLHKRAINSQANTCSPSMCTLVPN